MADNPKSRLVSQLRRLIGAPAPAELGDGPLLRQFADLHDESAFALLVQRHGPLVMRVCRQVLGHADDADDAFQATFLILARKAGSIRSFEALPSWLYRVAYHVAVQAKARAARRRDREQQAADPGKPFKAVPLDAPQVKTDKAAVVKGNSEFAFDLYAKLRNEKGNLFLSPYSISTALAMTTNGARANTLSQMEKTLRFPVVQDRLHPAFGALLQDSKSGKGYQLSVANALWCQINYAILDDFLKNNETYYGGRATGVDFAGKTEEARRTINTWVEKQTQDKIKELLKPGVLDTDTRVVLTNAICFKGDWAVKFKKEATREEPFLLASGQKSKAPLMHQKGKYKYLDGGGHRRCHQGRIGLDRSRSRFPCRPPIPVPDPRQPHRQHTVPGPAGRTATMTVARLVCAAGGLAK